MFYRIKATLPGKYAFTTGRESAVTEGQAQALYTLFRERFPEHDGWLVEAFRIVHLEELAEDVTPLIAAMPVPVETGVI